MEAFYGKIKKKAGSSYSDGTPTSSTKDLWVQTAGFCEKVRKETSSESYLSLLKFLYDYSTVKITKVGLKKMVANYFPDFNDDFLEVLEFYESLTQLSSESEKKIDTKAGEKKLNKNILTPSYKFLSKTELSRVQNSGITKIGKKVLNFSCYSKSSSSRNFKIKPEDPDEITLNKHEDELFESDMLLQRRRSTQRRANKLWTSIVNGKVKSPIDINNYFKVYNLRFIGKMYEEQGSTMLEHLRQSTEIALPIIIKRLKQMETSNEDGKSLQQAPQ